MFVIQNDACIHLSKFTLADVHHSKICMCTPLHTYCSRMFNILIILVLPYSIFNAIRCQAVSYSQLLFSIGLLFQLDVCHLNWHRFSPLHSDFSLVVVIWCVPFMLFSNSVITVGVDWINSLVHMKILQFIPKKLHEYWNACWVTQDVEIS
jgi:hypothetical protein